MYSLADAGGRGRVPQERIAVSAAFFANGLVVGGWAPQIPLLAQRHALSESALGLMILVLGAGAVAAMPLCGAAIARVGSRPPMVALTLLSACVLALVVVAPSLPLAGVAVFLFGATIGGADVAMNSNAVSVEKRMSRAIMSSCHGFWSVGGLIGAGTGGWLIISLGAAGHAMTVGGVVIASGAAVASWGLSDRRLLASAAPGASAPRVDASGGGGISAAGLMKAILIGVLALFAMIPEGAAIDWSAIYLRQELGAGVVASGFAFATFSATMALLRFAGDPLRDRLGAERTVRLCSAIGAAGLIVIGLAPTATVALTGFAIMGLGLANLVPIAFSAAGNVAGLPPGTGLSIATALGYSGILVAPSAVGLAAEHLGFGTIFIAMSALLIVTMAGAALLAGADGERRGGVGTGPHAAGSDATHKHEDQDHHQDRAEDAGGPVAPAPRVAPGR